MILFDQNVNDMLHKRVVFVNEEREAFLFESNSR